MAPASQLIDYQKIADAVRHYKGLGYTPLNAPWFVSRKAMEVTAPPGRRFCSSFIGDLVASGEQSFIQMWMDGQLPGSKWQCTTPCFRDEPVVDDLHLNYFMKVELIEVDPFNPISSIELMISYAKNFFDSFLSKRAHIINTEIGKDIVSSEGIELGSYGYREYGNFRWVYGTGVAEPRFSSACLKDLTLLKDFVLN